VPDYKYEVRVGVWKVTKWSNDEVLDAEYVEDRWVSHHLGFPYGIPEEGFVHSPPKDDTKGIMRKVK
jgi:hypothetical protein